MTAAPPRKRCRSVSHAELGRPRVKHVLSSKPQMTDAVRSPHATKPVARARNHHSCVFISSAHSRCGQLPWVEVTGGAWRLDAGAGGAGVAAMLAAGCWTTTTDGAAGDRGGAGAPVALADR